MARESTGQARADLIAQWDFYNEDVGNPDLADRFVACAETTFCQ